MGMQHYTRQRRSALDRFYLKNILVEDILVPQNALKIFVFVKTFPKGFKCKKACIFINSLNFWYFRKIKFTIEFYV